MEEMARDESVIHSPGKLTVDLKSDKVLLFARPPAVASRAKTQPASMKSGL
jgi:hypothetical protein